MGWGSEYNEKSFTAKLNLFLHSNKFDSIQADHLATEIKLPNVPWLRQSRVTFFLIYQMGVIFDLPSPIIRLFFYATDSCGGGHTVTFYMKEVWAAIVDRTALIKVKSGFWSPLAIDGHDGRFTARFVPKVCGGIRTIMLSRNSAQLISVLNDREILKSFTLLSRQERCKGFAIRDFNDLHQKWAAFHHKVSGYSQDVKQCRVYYVKADISQCFDNIPKQKLTEILVIIIKTNANLDISHITPGYIGNSKMLLTMCDRTLDAFSLI